MNSYPTQFASTFLIGNIKLASDFIMMGIIIFGMLAYSPVVVLCIGALTLVCGLGIRALTQSRLKAYSEMSRIRAPEQLPDQQRGPRLHRNLHVQRHGLREAGLSVKQPNALPHISEHGGPQTGPAKVYEVVAAISISGAIILSILLGKNDEGFLNLLMVLTLATYRIMPTISRGQLVRSSPCAMPGMCK